MAECLPSRTREDHFYTPSDMLDTVNSVLGAVGGKAEISRVTDRGVVIPATDNEVAVVDSSSRLKSCAAVVSKLSEEEKLEWSVARREEANAMFRIGARADAMQRYLEALVGLATFNESDASPRSVRAREQKITVLSNMGAVALCLKHYVKVIALCDEALRVDPSCYKALCRRGLANAHMEKFVDARADLNRARNACKGTEDMRSVQEVTLRVEQLEKKYRAERRMDMKRYAAAFGQEAHDQRKPVSSIRKRAAPSQVTGEEMVCSLPSRDTEAVGWRWRPFVFDVFVWGIAALVLVALCMISALNVKGKW